MSAVTIAVGGRWREIEDDNSKLRSKLADLEHQFLMQKNLLDHVSQKLEVATSETDALRMENMSKTDELHSLEASFCASTAEIAEMKATAEVSASMICHMNSQQDASSEKIQSLRQDLEEALREACQLKVHIASKEQALALESSLKKKAEAKSQLRHAELCTLESRLAKQGTHVQLLLRDKERLWSQLSRCRGTKETSKQEEESGTRGKEKVLKKDSLESKDETTGGQRKASTSRSCRSKASPAKPSAASASVAELERKLWHTQKALERERLAHEASKQELQTAVSGPVS